jgi:hypothetical protein
MIILAFLQNQWFKDPERVREMYAEHPEHRQRYIASFLFMGCTTGKRLEAAFGEDLCQEIIWEEASLEVAGYSAASFPADPVHIENTLLKFKPSVVLTFGKIASNGLRTIVNPDIDYYTGVNYHRQIIDEWLVHSSRLHLTFNLIEGPHPANRNAPMPRLYEMAQRIKELKSEVLELED